LAADAVYINTQPPIMMKHETHIALKVTTIITKILVIMWWNNVTGWWIRGSCWCAVSYQMDCARSCQLQSFYDQVRCLVVWYSHHRDRHIWSTTLPGYVWYPDKEFLWVTVWQCSCCVIMQTVGGIISKGGRKGSCPRHIFTC